MSIVDMPSRLTQHNGPARGPFWPVEAIEHYCGGNAPTLDATAIDAVLAELCGISRRTIARWRHEGVPDTYADRIAVRLGVHPCVLWGDAWFVAARDEEEFYETLRLDIPGAGAWPDSFYEAVAALVAVLNVQGIPPAPAIARANDVKLNTAQKWIQRARLRGLMPRGEESV